jgi:hypothetical protein
LCIRNIQTKATDAATAICANIAIVSNIIIFFLKILNTINYLIKSILKYFILIEF